MAVTDLPFSEVRLERRSLLPGYCIVVWKFGHVAEPTELDDGAATGYWRDVLSVVRVIEARFKPMKINLLTLGNWVPHLHTHVVPRYQDDPAPGGPIAYEAIFAEAPRPAAELQRHADGLRAALGTPVGVPDDVEVAGGPPPRPAPPPVEASPDNVFC